MDNVGAAYMNIDNGALGCNANHLKIWTWLAHHTDGDHDWAIALEDDALPVQNFKQQAKQALHAAPSPVVSFYLGKHHIPTLDIEQQKQQAITKAQKAEAHWITSNMLLHAVAIAIRADHIQHMLTHIRTLPDFLPIDEAITHWIANNHNVDVAYTYPSLVDHADTPTLFRHHDKMERPPGRVAYHVGMRHLWTDRSVHL